MNVPVSIFPKFLKTRNAEAHAVTLATLGFERADLLIRVAAIPWTRRAQKTTSTGPPPRTARRGSV